jgi:DNA replication protein DnaC
VQDELDRRRSRLLERRFALSGLPARKELLGDVVVTPLLDRLMHHSHLLKFEGKSSRLKEAATRVAKRARSA